MGNLTNDNTAGFDQNGQPQIPQAQPLQQTLTTSSDKQLANGQTPKEIFPTMDDLGRLTDYEYFNHLLMGEHFEAFAIRVNSLAYSRDYAKLKYVAANFAGLISKVCADMLFSEPVTPKAAEEGDQDFLENFWQDNKLDQQLYESQLDCSSLGDTCFKLRVGKRHENDKQSTVILEEFSPTIYFPKLNQFNIRGLPESIELSWTIKLNNIKYLRKEIHTPGMIENKVFIMNGNEVGVEVTGEVIGLDLKPQEATKIDRYLIFHIPNYKKGDRHFGISDYYDLDKLFYAINNRITKIDNILDKHADPILLVPDGVLDENGKVTRAYLDMIEVPEGAGNKLKPEYVVWDANLEAAFNEIDHLINFFMMTGEITKDVLGMGEGLSDSGRALKFKLMRTIAKVARKKLYYDQVIKDILYTAQLLAKAWDVGVGVDFTKLVGKALMPELKWQDGLPIDDYEDAQLEIQKIDAGIQSKKDAIMSLDDIDEEAAEEKLEDIDDENKLTVPFMKLAATNVDDQGNITPTTPKPGKATAKPQAKQQKTPTK